MTRTLLSSAIWPFTVISASSYLIAGYQLGWWIAAVISMPTLLLTGLYLLERAMPAGPGTGSHEDPERWNDIGHLVFGATLGETLGNGFLRLGAAALAMALPAAFDIWPHAWPLAGQIALLIVAAEFLEYWRHRLVHRIPLLWRAHELHHSGGNLNVLKSSRNHVLDLLMRAVTVFAPLVLLGAPPESSPFYTVAVLVFGPIAHANLALRFPHWLHYVISTPPVHALHHARDPRLSDRNFATLPLLDIVFGTFEHPAGHGRPVAGVAGPVPPKDFLGQLAAPFRDARRGAGAVTPEDQPLAA